MTSHSLNVRGIDVFIEGEGPHAVVMIHGWPDTYHLWDGLTNVLKQQYRCVRFTLPGFDLAQPARATSLEQTTELINAIVDAVSPTQPVTLVLHDWGCVFGYEFAACHPQRVARIVGVDVGDYNSGAYSRSLSVKSKLLAFAYQLWLAVAWKVGGTLGNRMTRWMARMAGCRAEQSAIGWQMNYPYAMTWFGLLGGFRGAAKVAHECPMLYIYGEDKPFMFHSARWTERISARPDCAVQSFKTGHWVMTQQPEAFSRCVESWLAGCHPPTPKP